MSESITGNQKKRGRPATGERAHIAARVSEEEVVRIDAWAEAHDVTRAEAIRRLVEMGLEAESGTDGVGK